MKPSIPSLCIASAVLILAGCTTIPTGPSIMVLPGAGKSFDHFRGDDMECRQYARYQIDGGNPDQIKVDSGVRNAAIGTAIGALAGAAIGGSRGAGVGAGAGLLVGSVTGSEAARGSGYSAQRNYDNAYTQCMYSKGHQVPVSGTMLRTQPQVQQQPQVQPQSAVPTMPSGSNFPPPPPPGWR
ncbi:MAG: YMGG-like glycine zipper-containing protein [Betaproteobacteria bacterium]